MGVEGEGRSQSKKTSKKSEKTSGSAEDVPAKKRQESKEKQTDLNTAPAPHTSKKKRKNVEEPKQEESETPAMRTQKKKKKKKQIEDTTDPPSATPPSQASLPTKGMKKAIRKYYNQFSTNEATMATEEIKQEMKSHLNLHSLTECRLNSYWKLGTCGVTSKSKKKDIGHFSFPDVEDLPYMAGLALCLKCAEPFVTLVHLVIIAVVLPG